MMKAWPYGRNKDEIINMDQTPIAYSFHARTTLGIKRTKTIQVRASTHDTKRFTVTATVTVSGKMLPPFMIFKGASRGCIATREFVTPAGRKYACQPKAWMDEVQMHAWSCPEQYDIWSGIVQLCNCIATIAMKKGTLTCILVIREHNLLNTSRCSIQPLTINSHCIFLSGKAHMATVRYINLNLVPDEIVHVNHPQTNLQTNTARMTLQNQCIATLKRMVLTRTHIVSWQESHQDVLKHDVSFEVCDVL